VHRQSGPGPRRHVVLQVQAGDLDLIGEAREAHVAVLNVASDTARLPLAVPLWYGYQPGGHLSFFTGTQGRKARKTRLIQKAGVLSLSTQRAEYP
jgi:nitroimidazol reductase NimA-like FMN-containing flavoprotein (pyridoxamine 5'-phosphate oxidase superfamily)